MNIPKAMHLSIIIPTQNNEEKIISIIQSIDRILRAINVIYEIIFIDDNSTDLTQLTIHKMYSLYPVSLFIKKGTYGKIQSLIEGIGYTKYEYIAMINPTLEYYPEILKEMIEKLFTGYDVIVTESLIREAKSTNTLEIIVCKKEVLERISLAPKAWDFELEFLTNARNAGYRIANIQQVPKMRFGSKPQIQKPRELWKIILSSIYLKLLSSKIIPFNENDRKSKGNGFHYQGQEFIHYSNLKFFDSAFFRLTHAQVLVSIAIIEILFIGLVTNWHTTLVAFIASITFIYFCDLLFNLFLIYKSFTASPEIRVRDEEINYMRTWPTYTILCPLYMEGQIVKQFTSAISSLDYPKDKLQVLLLLEEDDRETIAEITSLQLPPYISVVIAPHSYPKTKPKALNYGLAFAKGDYTVVYDAEDIPDANQLKKVILAFEKADPTITCIQAKLNFYNPYQNLLTRIFTAEYSLWFDLILTGLQSINAVIPLGGTSNHFRTKSLQQLKGWDSFNVTEDCDLGLRLVKHGYRTAIVNSTTYEEANSKLGNWFSQRGRWIKGYMQTYLVHVRNPSQFIQQAAIYNFLAFQLVIGGKIFSLFINPLMWIITICYFLFRSTTGAFIESFFPAPIFYMGIVCLIFGNFLYMYYYMVGCAKRGYFPLIKYGFVVPFYWLFMSISGWYALYKIFTNPHYWAKTHHGLHLEKSDVKKTKEKVIPYPSHMPSQG